MRVLFLAIFCAGCVPVYSTVVNIEDVNVYVKKHNEIMVNEADVSVKIDGRIEE